MKRPIKDKEIITKVWQESIYPFISEVMKFDEAFSPYYGNIQFKFLYEFFNKWTNIKINKQELYILDSIINENDLKSIRILSNFRQFTYNPKLTFTYSQIIQIDFLDFNYHVKIHNSQNVIEKMIINKYYNEVISKKEIKENGLIFISEHKEFIKKQTQKTKK